MKRFVILLIVIFLPSTLLLSRPSVWPYFDTQLRTPSFLFLKPDTRPVFPVDTINRTSSLIGTNIDKLLQDGKTGLKRATVAGDTSSTPNRIDKIWRSGDILNVQVVLEEKDVNLTLKVYNMLGKEVAEIHNGPARSDGKYTYRDTPLPNGIYICTLTGPRFRDTEKFIVSR